MQTLVTQNVQGMGDEKEKKDESRCTSLPG